MRRKLRSGRAALLSMAVVMAVLAAACSFGGDEAAENFSEVSAGLDGEGDYAEGPVTTTAGAEAPADEESPPRDALGSGGISAAVLQTVDLGRDIIFTADLTVAVDDVAASGEEATRIIQGLGGFLFGQQTTGAPEPRSVLTFKVRPENFQQALDRLGSIGDIRSQNVSADDVTEQLVDLEGRITTAAASVERLRTLLSEATDIKTVVELENELLERETQLETLRGSLRTLQDQVALATVVVTLVEAEIRPMIDVGVTSYLGHDGGSSCPGEPQLAVDEGAAVTVCYEVFNSGDTLLTDIEVRDPVLDLETADLIVVFGDPDGTIEPGQSVILAAEVVAERSLRTQTTVTAQPIGEDGEPLPDRAATTTVTTFIEAVDPGGIASFSEGLTASWEILVKLGQMLILAVGALLPFVWIPLVVWLVWQWRRRNPIEPEPVDEPEKVAVGTEASRD